MLYLDLYFLLDCGVQTIEGTDNWGWTVLTCIHIYYTVEPHLDWLLRYVLVFLVGVCNLIRISIIKIHPMVQVDTCRKFIKRKSCPNWVFACSSFVGWGTPPPTTLTHWGVSSNITSFYVAVSYWYTSTTILAKYSYLKCMPWSLIHRHQFTHHHREQTQRWLYSHLQLHGWIHTCTLMVLK